MTEKIVQYLLRLLCITVGVATLVTPSDPPPCECSNSQFVLHSGQTLIIEHQPKIQHLGFAPDDYRQEIVTKWYELGGLDFLALLECENGLRDPKRVGDGGDAHWLCQLNTRRHKEPLSPEWNDRAYQLSICYSKRKAGTKFYWPQRLIWGKKCSEVVKERFYIL